eukprot:5986538-Pleurochrysis_carterae.AAC.1
MPTGVGNICKSKVEAVMAIEMSRNIRGVSSVRAFPVAQSSPLYTDNAKPPKHPSILRTDYELRQHGPRRRDRELGANGLERRSGNQLRDGEHGDRKSGREVTNPRRSSTLNKRCEPFISLPTNSRIHRRHRSSRAHAASPVALF